MTHKTLSRALLIIGAGPAGVSPGGEGGREGGEGSEFHQLPQPGEPIDSAAFARLGNIFDAWYPWTVDLP